MRSHLGQEREKIEKIFPEVRRHLLRQTVAVAPDTNVVTDEDENEAQPENNDTPIPQKALNDTPPVPQPEPRPISLAQKCFVTTNLYRTCISLDSAAEATVQDERELVSVFQKNCTDNLDGSLIVSCPSDAQVSCLTETVGASASGPIDINKLTRYYGMDESLKKTVQSSCKDSGKII